MKKLLIILVVLTFTACRENEISNKPTLTSSTAKARQKVKTKNLEIFIPDFYPKDLLEYSSTDFFNLAHKKTSYDFYKVKHVKGNSLREIFDNTVKYYPNMNVFNGIEYKSIFPELTDKEIYENKEDLDLVIEKLMAFDISSAFSQLKDAKYKLFDQDRKLRGYIVGGWLNEVCTVAVIVSHARLDLFGLAQGTTETNANASTYGNPTNNGGSNDFQDAVRHGNWGVLLGKYGTWRYSNPSHAENVISQLLTAHECGQSGLATIMDTHNNKVALKYYSDHVVVTGNWPNRNTTINESSTTIGSYMASLPCILQTTGSGINSQNNGTLVRII